MKPDSWVFYISSAEVITSTCYLKHGKCLSVLGNTVQSSLAGPEISRSPLPTFSAIYTGFNTLIRTDLSIFQAAILPR
jgi:hypothetical protein